MARSSFKPGDIFRIPNGRREVQLVEGGPTPKPQLLGQERVGEHGDQGAGDDEVLLDLTRIGPGRLRAPGGDVELGDH